MNFSELRPLTIQEIADRIRSHDTSSSEIVNLVIEQIRRTDGKLRAYVTVCEQSSLELAHAAELELKAGHDLGPLHGIPVSVKDIFETKGIRTTCGSKLMRDYVPNDDATVVSRLKLAGAIVLGKLNTHEFALGYITPPTRNPWKLNRIPGGSSGGCAAAIAAGSALTTTGSDTTGSIRVPASFCGVVGLKPTYGRVSRAGVFPESWSLDHVGPITRRVEDAALMLSVMAGYDPLDPTSSHSPVPKYEHKLNTDVRGLRIGIPENYFFDHCEKEVQKALDRVIELLTQLGCKVVEFEFPRIPEIVAAYTAIDNCESSSYHESTFGEKPEEYNADVRLLLEQGMLIPATYYIQALRFRSLIFQEVSQLFNRFNVIVTPTEPLVAPELDLSRIRIDESEESLDSAVSRYVAPFNLIGLPALSIPCGFSSRGLPIGMQIVGYPYDEATVLRVGYAYQQAANWHLKFPEVG